VSGLEIELIILDVSVGGLPVLRLSFLHCPHLLPREELALGEHARVWNRFSLLAVQIILLLASSLQVFAKGRRLISLVTAVKFSFSVAASHGVLDLRNIAAGL